MNFKAKLSKRIQMDDIHAIILAVQNNPKQIKKIYDLVFDLDETVAYQAAWVLTHLSPQDNQWLYNRQNELIEEVLICRHPGKRRIILSLLYRQPLANPPRTDFLDFCLERMVSHTELPAVQSLCMKLAYELCLTIPELLQEFCSAMELIEPDLLPASLRAVHRNIRKAMKTGKSLKH